MKHFILTFLLLVPLALTAQPASNAAKALSLKYAIYLLTLADKRSDMDGPFQDITGEKLKTEGGYEFKAVKNFPLPEGVTKHYLFGAPKAWPHFAAELSPEGAQAMRAAIIEVLPNEEPKGTYTGGHKGSEKADSYYVSIGGKPIANLSINKSTGTGLLVFKAAY